MDYVTKIQERKYGYMERDYINQTFSMMYEMAMKLSQGGSHIGDYSKEILENNEKNYAGKSPKDPTSDVISKYKFPARFSLN
ncbi:MAG: hypothetical protein WD876_00040 [Candidatus Pacearchaeota archaeon]